MGLTYVNAEMQGPTDRIRRLRFLVDSGTGYCVLPPEAWKALGLKPRRVEHFNLADGTPIRRQVSECLIRLGGREGHTPVILGEPGDCALMGVFTLENLGLVLDPFRRQLLRMKHRL